MVWKNWVLKGKLTGLPVSEGIHHHSSAAGGGITLMLP
jgi:hypothetical protein